MKHTLSSYAYRAADENAIFLGDSFERLFFRRCSSSVDGEGGGSRELNICSFTARASFFPFFKSLSSSFAKFRGYVLANVLVTSTIPVGLEFLIGRDMSKK